MSSNEEASKHLTVAEAAARLRVSHQTVRNLIKRGELRVLKLPGKFLIPVESVERFEGGGGVVEVLQPGVDRFR